MPNNNQYSTNAYAAEVARLMAVRRDRIDTYRQLLSSQTPGIQPVYNSQYQRSMYENIWEQQSQSISANEVAQSYESNEAADIMLSINEARPLINEQLISEYKDLIQQNGAPTDWEQWIKKANEPAVTKFDLIGGA